jgi:hypothetical protein
MDMVLQTKDIDQLLEATIDIEEDNDCGYMLFEIDIDELLEMTHHW